jgi:hypothetical protein
VHPRYVEGRIGIGITALLTLVALQITSNSSLPEVDYLLLLDKLYILSYGFVVLTLAVIVRNSWVDATGDVARATRADRRGLAVLTACYFLAAALISVFSLSRNRTAGSAYFLLTAGQQSREDQRWTHRGTSSSSWPRRRAARSSGSPGACPPG